MSFISRVYYVKVYLPHPKDIAYIVFKYMVGYILLMQIHKLIV